MPPHDPLYDAAELYDIAFDFKDVPAECGFLLACAARHGRPVASFLELAAGPGHHALEMARRGLRAHALDLNPEMRRYGLGLAEREGVEVGYHLADMCRFELGETVDLVAILMSSAAYLLDNEMVLSHLESVSRVLNPGGLYVLEMAHPRDYHENGQVNCQTWEMSRGDIHVRMTWGLPGDVMDPITQITHTHGRLAFRTPRAEGVIETEGPQRFFGAAELDALVRASGRFDLVATYGALDLDVPFDMAPAAWRMIPVLRRR